MHYFAYFSNVLLIDKQYSLLLSLRAVNCKHKKQEEFYAIC